MGYATRGCPNNCKFCAVNKIEPEFIHYSPLKRQVCGIGEIYGKKQDLILLDNNVFASNQFPRIIQDIIDLGFEKGAKLGLRMRKIDFNQGVDGRLLDRKKMELLAKIAIRPLRIAFDDIRQKDQYIANIRMAAEFGILNLSNYVLYNFIDTPEDFYERLRINCELNEELGTKIYSFPMKFIPLNSKDRTFVGKHWNKKLLRGVQCILLATRGLVSPRLEFFEAAFGRDAKEFIKIALMPEEYIIQRENHKFNGASEWGRNYEKLNVAQKNELFEILRGQIDRETIKGVQSRTLKTVLKHYIVGRDLERRKKANNASKE